MRLEEGKMSCLADIFGLFEGDSQVKNYDSGCEGSIQLILYKVSY